MKKVFFAVSLLLIISIEASEEKSRRNSFIQKIKLSSSSKKNKNEQNTLSENALSKITSESDSIKTGIDLIEAIKLGNIELAKQLITEGVDVTFCDDDDRDALSYAAQITDDPDLIEQLVTAGADPEREALALISPYGYAVAYGTFAVAEKLIELTNKHN